MGNSEMVLYDQLSGGLLLKEWLDNPPKFDSDLDNKLVLVGRAILNLVVWEGDTDKWESYGPVSAFLPMGEYLAKQAGEENATNTDYLADFRTLVVKEFREKFGIENIYDQNKYVLINVTHPEKIDGGTTYMAFKRD